MELLFGNSSPAMMRLDLKPSPILFRSFTSVVETPSEHHFDKVCMADTVRHSTRRPGVNQMAAGGKKNGKL